MCEGGPACVRRPHRGRRSGGERARTAPRVLRRVVVIRCTHDGRFGGLKTGGPLELLQRRDHLSHRLIALYRATNLMLA